MATVNVPAEWVLDQTLSEDAPVDYFVFNSTLTEGEPISVAAATDPAVAKTKTATKTKS